MPDYAIRNGLGWRPSSEERRYTPPPTPREPFTPTLFREAVNDLFPLRPGYQKPDHGPKYDSWADYCKAELPNN